MKKKILKIAGIGLLVIIALLIAIPFFLEGKIATIVKNKVNQNVNATLDFEEANLSLIKSFPNAYVDLTNTTLINKAPFEGDTLFAAGNVALSMSIKELFKSADEPISIKSLTLDEAKLHIKVDEEENANYDIAKETENDSQKTEEEATDSFTLALETYELTNSEIIYDDFSTKTHLVVSEINHSGTGDLSIEKSELQTKTDALVSFELDSTKYLSKNKVSLDALIGIDLKENKYSFLENKALVNQLPLVFDGFVKVNEENQEVDISFKTPSSDFKNFLAVIPEEYSKNIENVTTTGNFEVDGITYVNINKLSFQIDEDRFNVNAKIRELLGNTKVNAHADGKINLANIAKAYPMPADLELSGLLTTDATTAFDTESILLKEKRVRPILRLPVP